MLLRGCIKSSKDVQGHLKERQSSPFLSTRETKLRMPCFFAKKGDKSSLPSVLPPPIDPLHDLQLGYPKLAGRMAVLPEIAMFKRFGALNARNLLYMQSELMMLEARLKQVEAEDAMTMQNRKQDYSRDFYWLHYSEIVGPDTKQLNLIRRIREILKDYSAFPASMMLNALLMYGQIKPSYNKRRSTK
jgi:hypothetical protein